MRNILRCCDKQGIRNVVLNEGGNKHLDRMGKMFRPSIFQSFMLDIRPLFENQKERR